VGESLTILKTFKGKRKGIFIQELMFSYPVIAPMLAQRGSPIDLESKFVGNAAISFKKLVMEAQLHIYGYPIYLTGPKVLKLPTDSLINYSYKHDSLWQGFEKKWIKKKRLGRKS
jgi:hypothetical protein